MEERETLFTPKPSSEFLQGSQRVDEPRFFRLCTLLPCKEPSSESVLTGIATVSRERSQLLSETRPKFWKQVLSTHVLQGEEEEKEEEEEEEEGEG